MAVGHPASRGLRLSPPRSSCPGDDGKGIVASFDAPAGVFVLWDDARPKIRSFRIFNSTAAAQSVKLDLLCVRDRTGPAVAAGAPLPPLAFRAHAGYRSRTLSVGVSCPAGGPACSARVTVATAASRRAIVSTRVALRPGHARTLRLRVGTRGAHRLAGARTVIATVRHAARVEVHALRVDRRSP